MHLSKIANSIESNIFLILENKRQELLKQGREVINLSVGTPDFPPDAHVMEALQTAAAQPENYRYSLKDIPALTAAVQRWYERRYGVQLQEEEITSVNGSQEGFAHIAFPLIDPGDTVIVSNPGYPVFSFGPQLAGAQLYETPLLRENDFLIDFASIPEQVARQAKMIVVSYPTNPVTVTAPRSFYKELVAFAKEYDIVVVHDNAYSEIILDGEPGGSFLSIPGAKEVGIELNSLSKSYNMTGCRISFALGNAEIIRAFKKVRSQIDYGIFLPIQYAAIAALDGPQDILERNRLGYRARRDALCQGLRNIGWDVPDSPATMFVWAPLPKHYTDSMAFTMDLIERAGVICIPGESFGSLGRQYVRFGLTAPVPTIRQAVRQIQQSGIFEK